MFCRFFRLLVLLAAAFLPSRVFGLDTARPVQLLSIKNWHAEEGFKFGRARAVRQTRDGYLWAGTYEGLIRFDGVKFEEFTSSSVPELKNSVITALCEDSEGTLWIGTQGGITLYTDGRWETPREQSALPSLRVNAIVNGPGGEVWIATDGGLTVVSGRKYSRVFLDPKALGSEVNALAFSSGRVLFATPRGIGTVAASGVDVLYQRDRDDPVEISALLEKNGDILFGMKSRPGLGVLSSGKVQVWGKDQGFPDAIVASLLEDRNGGLWAGTLGSGLCRKSSAGFDVLDQKRGLPADHIQALTEDREGGLWAASYLGILRVSETPFVTIGARHGLPFGVRCVLAGPDGVVLAGTSAGVYAIEDGGARLAGLAREEVRSLFKDREGRLWAGTRSRLAILSLGTGGVAKDRTVIDGITVSEIAQDVEGRIWVTTNGQGIHILDGEKPAAQYGPAEGFSSRRTGPVAVARNGDLWVGTFGAGLNRFRKGKVTVFSEKEGIPPVSIMALYEDADDALWIGASPGLFRFKNGRLSRIPKEALPEEVTLYGILEDGQGKLWINSSIGVMAAFKKSLDEVADGISATVSFETYDITDGLPSTKCIAGSQPICARGPEGKLYFAKDRGLTFFDSRARRPVRPEPVLLVEEIRSRDTRIKNAAAVELPLGYRDLEIRYTAAAFDSPESLRFRYCLEGYESGWVEAGTRRAAFYTGLPPGEFVFKVICSVAGGPFSEHGARRVIRVPARTSESRLFQALVVLLSAGFVGLSASMVYRARLRALAREQEKLQQLVDLRTEELSTANEELARLNDEKDELLGIVAHDLKNPLAVIRGYVEVLNQMSSIPRAQQEVMFEKIDRAAARMFDLVKNLLEVNAIQRGTVHTESKPVDLLPLVDEVFELHRLRAEGKGQKLLLESAPQLPKALTDPRLLVEILDNLVSNAVKYSPAGKEVFVRINPKHRAIEIAVIDQGPGLTEDDQKRLFQPFTKLSAKPTGGESSTGLGLSVVKKLAAVIGAEVSCKSAPGHGSTFTLSVPQCPPELLTARRSSGSMRRIDLPKPGEMPKPRG